MTSAPAYQRGLASEKPGRSPGFFLRVVGRRLSTHIGHSKIQHEAVTGWKWMPGFMDYLCLYKNQTLAAKPLI